VKSLAVVAIAALALAGCGAKVERGPQKTARAAPCPTQPSGEVALAGGTFTFGAAGVHPEEGPAVKVTLAPFSIDRTEVTNAQFAEFVKATGYMTLAERSPDPKFYPGVPADQLRPSAMVFVGAEADPKGANPALWWRVVEGADWKHPLGPGSDITGKDREPVRQVAYEDALAYAKWRGRDLPTEAEWEYAARGGLDGARYTWGDEKPDPKAPAKANTWQGVFPAVDTGDDGYKASPAPVACYPANGFGLYDMAGNVWEWTRDWYRPGHAEGGKDPGGPSVDLAFDPADPASRQPKHVIKGGSFLCSDDFCYRYRPPAREAGPPDTGASHVGFRTVKRAGPPPEALPAD